MSAILANVALWIWIPIVLAIFASKPPRDAVITAYIFGWLFLPNVSFPLSGIPDWSKMTATVAGTMLAAILFDMTRLLSFRPRWYDMPVTLFCLSPFASSMLNSQGAWDGMSAVVDQAFCWGFPYFLGRIYLGDAASLRKMALGVVVGGLLYVPFCLVEMRLSPCFSRWVYGLYNFEGKRLDGFRPVVFLQTGLQLGMWMTTASLLAIWLWYSKSVRTLGGYSFGLLTLGLTVVTLLCRSTGATVQMVFGLFVLWLCRLTKCTLPAWILILIPALYVTTRSTGIWSGAEAVSIAETFTDSERAHSLDYRIECEDILIRSAIQKPLFGWARAGGFNTDSSGRMMAVTDGYWIITFGYSGFVGEFGLESMMLLPLILMTFRFRAARWKDPEVGPAVALGVVLVLYMIDNLSNAMLNPIYALIAGGVSGLKTAGNDADERLNRASEELDQADALVEEGRPAEALASYQRAVSYASGAGLEGPEASRARADAFRGMGHALLALGQPEEAELAIGHEFAIRVEAGSADQDVATMADLARSHESLARCLAAQGRISEAASQWSLAIVLWSKLVEGEPGDESLRSSRASARNDLAWLLAAVAGPSKRDPARAIELATEATREADDATSWNTLGVALYRSGDWAGAVDALVRSVELSQGGTAFDHFFLAMAYLRLGERDLARNWFDRAVDWADRHRPGHRHLDAIRAEAAALLVS